MAYCLNQVLTAKAARLSPQRPERVAVAAASKGSGATAPECLKTNHAIAQTGYAAV
jgi:hypothetical protein